MSTVGGFCILSEYIMGILIDGLYSPSINTFPPIVFIDLNGSIEWGVVYRIVSMKAILSIL